MNEANTHTLTGWTGQEKMTHPENLSYSSVDRKPKALPFLQSVQSLVLRPLPALIHFISSATAAQATDSYSNGCYPTELPSLEVCTNMGIVGPPPSYHSEHTNGCKSNQRGQKHRKITKLCLFNKTWLILAKQLRQKKDRGGTHT